VVVAVVVVVVGEVLRQGLWLERGLVLRLLLWQLVVFRSKLCGRPMLLLRVLPLLLVLPPLLFLLLLHLLALLLNPQQVPLLAQRVVRNEPRKVRVLLLL
jgi:hypothetical protein